METSLNYNGILCLLVVSVPVEGHSALPVSPELALVDGDGLLQNAVAVDLAVKPARAILRM